MLTTVTSPHLVTPAFSLTMEKSRRSPVESCGSSRGNASVFSCNECVFGCVRESAERTGGVFNGVYEVCKCCLILLDAAFGNTRLQSRLLIPPNKSVYVSGSQEI